MLNGYYTHKKNDVILFDNSEQQHCIEFAVAHSNIDTAIRTYDLKFHFPSAHIHEMQFFFDYLIIQVSSQKVDFTSLNTFTHVQKLDTECPYDHRIIIYS